MTVLLEEHPLKGLCIQVPIDWQIIGASGQVAEYGIRFRQETTVIELQQGYLAVGVFCKKIRFAAIAGHDVHGNRFMADAEEGTQ